MTTKHLHRTFGGLHYPPTPRIVQLRRSTASRTYATEASPPITPLSGALGATIHDIDLTQPLSPSTTAAIHAHFLHHGVIFFRQPRPLPPPTFLSLASHFGTPIEYPFISGIPGHPHIIRVLKQEHETTNFGGIWHSDTTYLAQPPMATLLMALQVPRRGGGDTLFANQYLAYEALSDGLKRTLQDLKAVNSSAKADVSKTREDRLKDPANNTANATSAKPASYEATHPVVRTHPATGRKALYVNVAHTSHFAGWTPEESAPLLAFLHAWQVRPEFTARFRWEVGSVAVWDNRCVLHCPINDYQGERREMLRVTLEGGVPV